MAGRLCGRDMRSRADKKRETAIVGDSSEFVSVVSNAIDRLDLSALSQSIAVRPPEWRRSLFVRRSGEWPLRRRASVSCGSFYAFCIERAGGVIAAHGRGALVGHEETFDARF